MDWPTISVAAAMVAFSIAAWGIVARRHRSGQPLVPLEPRRDVPWRFLDLLMIAAFYMLAGAALLSIAWFVASPAGDDGANLLGGPVKEPMTAAALMVTTATSVATNLAATVFALLWILSHTDATWRDLGWRREAVGGDLRLGLWAFAAVAVPIYGMQAILSPLARTQHPIIEVLSRERTPLLYVLTGLSAVAVAPLAEEFFFRVLLQGWIERLASRSALPDVEGAEPSPRQPQRRAIVASSLVFALMHWGHGYDSIPLFFLALALGYLYQRTHRLLPSVTVHFCLNACSYLMLCVSPTG